MLGYDNREYWVSDVWPAEARGPVVTIVDNLTNVATGPFQPPPGTPITVLRSADMTIESEAFTVLHAAGLDPQLMRETYQP